MRALVVLTACFVACVARQQTLEEFILSFDDPMERWRVLETVYQKNNNQMPKDLETVLINNRIIYPGMDPNQYNNNNNNNNNNYYAPQPVVSSLPAAANLSRSEQMAMYKFMQDYKRNQAISAQQYVPQKIFQRRRQPCHVDDDCPFQMFCSDIPGSLMEELKKRGLESHYYYVSELVDVHSKVCSKRPTTFMQQDAQYALPSIERARAKINRVFDKTKARKGFDHYVQEMDFVKVYDMNRFVVAPTTRHAEIGGLPQNTYSGGLDLSTLFFFSLLDGGLDGDDNLSSLMLLSFLGGDLGGAGGLGDIMGNPFLLISLLGDGGLGSGNDLMSIIILSQLGGGAGGSSLLIPLYLMSAQNNTGNSFLLPLLLTGSLGGGQHGCPPGASQNSITQYLLYDALLGDDNDNDNFALIFLMGGGGGCGGLGNNPIELLLLQNFLGEGSGLGNFGNNSMLILLLMSGLGTGGAGGFDAPLVLLSLFDDSLNITELITLSFLADPNFIGNDLALLLLFSGDFLGGGGISNLLILSLFMSQGNRGLTGTQTITTQPLAVTDYVQGLPPPGPALNAGNTYTVGSQTSSTTSTGIFDGLFGGLGGGGGGFGIWEYIIFSNLLGGDGEGLGLIEIFLFMQILGTNILGGATTGPAPIGPAPIVNQGAPVYISPSG